LTIPRRRPTTKRQKGGREADRLFSAPVFVFAMGRPASIAAFLCARSIICGFTARKMQSQFFTSDFYLFKKLIHIFIFHPVDNPFLSTFSIARHKISLYFRLAIAYFDNRRHFLCG
jgi:hypothetical protein